MECGSAPLCGVLTVDSGLGESSYHHRLPVVHGLWPEIGRYGTSRCEAPSSNRADPTTVYSCFQQEGESTEQLLSFERHEWEKHGVCAGVKDQEDFFSQICSLARGPISTLTSARNGGADFGAMDNALARAGYPVFYVDYSKKQFQLSACAGNDGIWRVAPVREFSEVCAGTAPPPSPSPSPPLPPSAECMLNAHGPRCHSNADCEGVSGCVRCAHSGYCTSVPLNVLVA